MFTTLYKKNELEYTYKIYSNMDSQPYSRMTPIRTDKVKCTCGAIVKTSNMTNHRRRMFHMLWLHQSLSYSK